MIKESFQAQVAELQNSLDQQQSEIQKLKERQEEERTEWRTKHDEQIASIEVNFCALLIFSHWDFIIIF